MEGPAGDGALKMEIEENIPPPVRGADRVATLRALGFGEWIDIAGAKEIARWRNAMVKASARGDRHFISKKNDGGIYIQRIA